MRTRTLIFGGAIGAAVMYFTDPDAGRGRRTRLRDQAMARFRDLRHRNESRRRYVDGVREGLMAEMASPGPDNMDPDDATLEQRIRSMVFGSPDIPSDRINLEVVNGHVAVRGEADSKEQIEETAMRISEVPGVREVEVLLHLPGEPAPNKEVALQASRDAETTTDRINRATG